MRLLRLTVLAAVAASLTGCRFKGLEAFTSATTPRAGLAGEKDFGDAAKSREITASGENRADWGKYSQGGIADATGGQNAATRYGMGSRNAGTVQPGYDQPQKGTGQQPGEYPNVAAPGHAQTNAPAFQPSPSDVGH